MAKKQGGTRSSRGAKRASGPRPTKRKKAGLTKKEVGTFAAILKGRNKRN